MVFCLGIFVVLLGLSILGGDLDRSIRRQARARFRAQRKN